MTRLLSITCTLIVCATACATTPSTESIERLMKANDTTNSLVSIQRQFLNHFEAVVFQTLKERGISSGKAQPALDSGKEVLLASIKDVISVEAFKAIYFKVYRETLSQSEVDGLIAIYEGPLGKTLLEKLPRANERATNETQQQFNAMMQQLLQSFQERRNASQDKAITNNARQLRAASDWFCEENNVTSAQLSDLVGPTKFMKELGYIAGETYPATIEKGKPIVILKADGSKITYD